jgi:uncharacterized protein DUF397
VAPLVIGVAVRDSKNAEGPMLAFPLRAWRELAGHVLR